MCLQGHVYCSGRPRLLRSQWAVGGKAGPGIGGKPAQRVAAHRGCRLSCDWPRPGARGQLSVEILWMLFRSFFGQVSVFCNQLFSRPQLRCFRHLNLSKSTGCRDACTCTARFRQVQVSKFTGCTNFVPVEIDRLRARPAVEMIGLRSWVWSRTCVWRNKK